MTRRIYVLGCKLAERFGFYEARYKNYAIFISRLLVRLIYHNRSNKLYVIDLGCGSGLFSKYFRKLATVVGIDIRYYSQWMIYETNPSNLFILADARRLPLRSNSINVVFALSLLEHVEGWKRIMAETFRVLKQGGILIIQLPNLKYIVEPHTKFPLLSLFPKFLKRIITSFAGYPELQFNCTINNVVKEGLRLGFRIIGIVYYHHKSNLRVTRILSSPSFFIVFLKPLTYSKQP